jgi:hypothetical protein
MISMRFSAYSFAKRIDDFLPLPSELFLKEKKDGHLTVCKRGYCWKLVNWTFGRHTKYDLNHIFDASLVNLAIQGSVLQGAKNATKSFDFKFKITFRNKDYFKAALKILNQEYLVNNRAGRAAILTVICCEIISNKWPCRISHFLETNPPRIIFY